MQCENLRFLVVPAVVCFAVSLAVYCVVSAVIVCFVVSAVDVVFPWIAHLAVYLL